MDTAILLAFDEGYLQPGLVVVSTAPPQPNRGAGSCCFDGLSDDSEDRLRALPCTIGTDTARRISGIRIPFPILRRTILGSRSTELTEAAQ